jgi:hypothetical protein
MEKSFDTKDLAARLEAKGLPAVEGLAEVVLAEVFGWTEESLQIHENPLVKAIGIPALNILKPLAQKAVDKIDGQEG